MNNSLKSQRLNSILILGAFLVGVGSSPPVAGQSHHWLELSLNQSGAQIQSVVNSMIEWMFDSC